MGLWDSGVAAKLLSSGEYQKARILDFLPQGFSNFWPFHLPFSFLVLSFIHPILFAIASVEVAKRRYPFALYCVIQIVFSASIVTVAISNLQELSYQHFFGNVFLLHPREVFKNVAALVASPLLCYISLYWWRKPIMLWKAE
jgi:hypothetical protein